MDETQAPIIYVPQQSKPQPLPAPQYELKKDVTGEEPPKRGSLFIEVLVPDKNNKRTKVRVQVPNLPKKSCKVCYGKGYVGFETKSQKILFCHKCFRPN